MQNDTYTIKCDKCGGDPVFILGLSATEDEIKVEYACPFCDFECVNVLPLYNLFHTNPVN